MEQIGLLRHAQPQRISEVYLATTESSATSEELEEVGYGVADLLWAAKKVARKLVDANSVGAAHAG